MCLPDTTMSTTGPWCVFTTLRWIYRTTTGAGRMSSCCCWSLADHPELVKYCSKRILTHELGGAFNRIKNALADVLPYSKRSEFFIVLQLANGYTIR